MVENSRRDGLGSRSTLSPAQRLRQAAGPREDLQPEEWMRRLVEAARPTVEAMRRWCREVSQRLEGVWRQLEVTARLMEPWLRAIGASQDPLSLLPRVEDLLEGAPAEYRRHLDKLSRGARLPTEKEILSIRAFRKLPTTVKRYLVLLGLLGDLAVAENERPGAFAWLSRGSEIRLLALAAVTPGEWVAAGVQRSSFVALFVLKRYGFRATWCERGHWWLAPPGSHTSMGCPVHRRAVKQARWRARKRQGLVRSRHPERRLHVRTNVWKDLDQRPRR